MSVRYQDLCSFGLAASRRNANLKALNLKPENLNLNPKPQALNVCGAGAKFCGSVPVGPCGSTVYV